MTPFPQLCQPMCSGTVFPNSTLGPAAKGPYNSIANWDTFEKERGVISIYSSHKLVQS